MDADKTASGCKWLDIQDMRHRQGYNYQMSVNLYNGVYKQMCKDGVQRSRYSMLVNDCFYHKNMKIHGLVCTFEKLKSVSDGLQW